MKQVFLSGQGKTHVLDAPTPARQRGSVLVRNAYSLISSGTEGAAVTRHQGVRGLYEKALKSRSRLGQVWAMVQSQGLASTVSAIQTKLDDFTPLGYSCAGVVLEVDSDDLGLKVGQRVACMGAGFANHAEYVSVPKHLAVPLPESVRFEDASFGALACIAMQGVRRLELSPGESVAVIGLGLIGQIALRLASLMGYRAYGLDIRPGRVEWARRHGGAIHVFDSSSTDAVRVLMRETSGNGVDGVLICASTPGDDLVNQAFELCRRRGRVSVVGDIGLGLNRAKMYAKELEVRLSCSYGVGRYDPLYEVEGIDYPLPFARWTENRNLEYFVQLLAAGRLQLADLVSAKVPVSDAREAYALIKSGDNSIYGVLLDYQMPEVLDALSAPRDVQYRAASTEQFKLGLGLIGVGAYAKNVHVPNLLANPLVDIRAVASRSGGSAAVAAKRVNAEYATSDVGRIFSDPRIQAVVISTRHASHAQLAIDALAAGKHLFVEKPLATTTLDCLRVCEAQQASGRVVRVGFNRRFAPMLEEMKRQVGLGRKVFNIRVNVGAIAQHWSNTQEEGGRLLGEGVHFIDLANWMMDDPPKWVTASFVGEADLLNPDCSIAISYEDGSVANVSYVTLGSGARGKEFFEMFGNGRTVVVDNYKSIRTYGGMVFSRGQKGDKGQRGAMDEFVRVARGGDGGGGADASAGLWATAISEAALESARRGVRISMAEFIREQRRSLDRRQDVHPRSEAADES